MPRTRALVFAAWLTALAVAGLLGSGRLVASAERQPFGPRRDALVGGARAVDGLARRLGLDAPARAIDRALGRPAASAAVAGGAVREGGAPADATPRAAEGAVSTRAAASATPRPGAPRTAVAARATATAAPSASPTAARRSVSPDAPLRVQVAGDSFAQPLGYELGNYATRDALLSVGLDFQISTGLVRDDYFDWPARMAETMTAAPPPEVVVFLLGANEDQNMRVAADRVLIMGAPDWEAEYARRAGRVMDEVAAGGARMIWIGMPAMRDPDMARAIEAATRGAREAAAARPWVTFLDTRPMFAGPDGGFAAYLPGPDGTPIEMRGDDGIHLTRPGTNRVAARVYELLRADWALRTPTPTPTATATPTASATPTDTATATATVTATATSTATLAPSATATPRAARRSTDRAPAAATVTPRDARP